jgi:addiction module HigA family antidote
MSKLWTTTNPMRPRKQKLSPVHPGEVLREEFMKPLKLSASAVARGLSVAPDTISRLIRGRRHVNAELALRLSRYVGTTAEFWMGLQGQYDLDVAQDELEGRIAREVRRCPLVRAIA